MKNQILSLEDIINAVKPLVQKYHISEVYLFGSYARGEADKDSDVDILVIGGEHFKLTNIFAFGEELRIALDKPIDAFEIHEVNTDSEFYRTIMEEKVKIIGKSVVQNHEKKRTFLRYVLRVLLTLGNC